MRYRWLLIAMVLCSAIHAEPPTTQPKEQTNIPGWGAFVDPAHDCQAKSSDGKLTITVPGTEHNLNPTPAFNNILGPRALQSVTGDFTVQVKVSAFPPPEPNTSTDNQGHSFVSAGLLVWKDDQSFIRFMRGGLGERRVLFTHLETFDQGKRKKSDFSIHRLEEAAIPDKPLWLRIERKGDAMTLSRSLDGQKWEEFATQHLADWPAQLSVGVGVVNATNKDFAPQFEQFELHHAGQSRS
jgi:regulation of enolase protein 1 (concanavalin A-like superfamily)